MNALMLDTVAAAVPGLAADVELIAVKALAGALEATLVSADAQARVVALQQDQAQTTGDGLISGDLSGMTVGAAATADPNMIVVGGGVPAGLQSLAASLSGQNQQSVTVIGGDTIPGLDTSAGSGESVTVIGGDTIPLGGTGSVGDASGIGLQLEEAQNQAIFDENETWLAPDGTDYLGEDSSGSMTFEDSAGNIGDLGEMYTNDEGTTSIF
jgi:hypothetical protein